MNFNFNTKKAVEQKKTALVYVNPSIVRGQLNYYRGAIENKLAPIASALHSKGFSITVIANEFDAHWLRNRYPDMKVCELSTTSMIKSLGSADGLEDDLYTDPNGTQVSSFVQLFRTLELKEPNLIVAWETPTEFLQNLFPNAICLNLMPGFLSRLPFPELFTIDTAGLFGRSHTLKAVIQQTECPAHPDAIGLLQDLRTDVLPTIAHQNPFPRTFLDPTQKFRRVLLLPLQVSDHYAFRSDCAHRSQISMLLEVLSKLPDDIGLVITQYRSNSASDIAIDDEKLAELRAKWHNIIYDKSFERIDHSSQYLLSSVDGVVSFSSSISLQALLWSKPFIAVGNSHLSGFATHERIEDWLLEGAPINVPASVDNHLANLLSYSHILREKLIDPDFLARWIDMAEERKPNFPCVFELDPNYRHSFLAGVKAERASKVRSDAFGNAPNSKLEQRFSKALCEAPTSLISFDIFDTLVDRKIEQPIHVFDILQNEVFKLTNGRIANFAQVRKEAERYLRERLKDSNQNLQEVTLSQIYAFISEMCGISSEIAESIKQMEKDEELRQFGVRSSGERLFNLAVASGRRIILICDMYLPGEFIQEILQKCGYPKETPLYLSSVFGLRKHEGQLFDAVLRREKVPTSRWLHIGDNSHGDIKIPKAKGIRTFHIRSTFQNVAQNNKYGVITHGDKQNRCLAEAAIYGLVQRRFFDNPHHTIPSNTHFGGEPVMLGYAGMGPVFFGFLSWLMVDARERGIEKVIFLSRDGYPLWRMAEKLYPTQDGWSKVDYAYGSRSAIRLANIQSQADILSLVKSSLSPMTLRDFFKRKFNFDLNNEHLQKLYGVGIMDLDICISASDRSRLMEAALMFQNSILAIADAQRVMLQEYYASKGIGLSEKCAIVDIGYSGSLQAGISRITGERDLTGYYYITFNSAYEWKQFTGPMRGYAGEFVNPKLHPDPICQNGFLFETLFCSAEDSFKGFRRNKAVQAVPIFDVVNGDGARRELVSKVHEGAVLLAQDLTKNFGHIISKLQLPSSSATQQLNDMIKNPSGRHAEMFEGCIFDDGFSSSFIRYIVPKRDHISQNKEVISQAIWKQGAAVFSRIPNVENLSASHVQSKRGNSAVASGAIKYSNGSDNTPFIERFLVKSFVMNKAKRSKYRRDRHAFFRDSRSKILKKYYQKIIL